MTPIEKERRAQAWLGFATAAVASIAARYELANDDDDPEGECGELCEVAAYIADGMLEEFSERFGPKAKAPKSKRRARDDDEEESE